MLRFRANVLLGGLQVINIEHVEDARVASLREPEAGGGDEVSTSGRWGRVISRRHLAAESDDQKIRPEVGRRRDR